MFAGARASWPRLPPAVVADGTVIVSSAVEALVCVAEPAGG